MEYIKELEKTRSLEHHYISLIGDTSRQKLELLKFMADTLVDINTELKILNHHERKD